MALNMQPYLILPVSGKDEVEADAAAIAAANNFQSTSDDLCFVFYVNMKHNKIGVVFSDKFYPYAQRLGLTTQVLTMNFNDMIGQQISASGDVLAGQVMQQISTTNEGVVTQVLQQLSDMGLTTTSSGSVTSSVSVASSGVVTSTVNATDSGSAANSAAITNDQLVNVNGMLMTAEAAEQWAQQQRERFAQNRCTDCL